MQFYTKIIAVSLDFTDYVNSICAYPDESYSWAYIEAIKKVFVNIFNRRALYSYTRMS